LLDVALNDPSRVNPELIDRLRAVNARAIDLTEALLLLTRADQRTFTRDNVDLSLVAEEATETLLPLAAKHRVTLETAGEPSPTSGSHALLLQIATNLVHNAIVHNLPDHGTMRVTTSARPETVVLTVENTGEDLASQLVSTLAEPFQRGTQRIRADHPGVGLGLAIVKSIAQAHDGTLTITSVYRAAGSGPDLPRSKRLRARFSAFARRMGSLRRRRCASSSTCTGPNTTLSPRQSKDGREHPIALLDAQNVHDVHAVDARWPRRKGSSTAGGPGTTV
jgi:signal transduction histidine kinase